MAEPKIGIEITGDASKIQAAIKGVNDDLVRFAQQSATLAEKLATVTVSTGATSKEARALSKELSGVQANMRALEKSAGASVTAANTISKIGAAALGAKTQVGGLGGALAKLQGAIGGVSAASGKMISALGGIGKLALPMGLAAGGGAGVMGVAAKDAIDFQARMKNVQAISGGESNAQIAAESRRLLNMPVNEGVAVAPQKLAESLYQVKSAGYAGAEAIGVMKQSMKLASAGLIDGEQATLAMTRSLHSYDASAQEASFHSDVMTKIIAAGQVRGEELAAVWSQLASAGHLAHVKVQDLGAAFATMTAHGANAGQAATYMEALMKSIAMPRPEAKKNLEIVNAALKAHGMTQISRAGIDKGGILGVMQSIQAVAGDDPAKLAAILGKRQEAIMGVAKLMSDGGAMLAGNVTKTFSAKSLAGETERQLKIQRESVAYHLKLLGAQFESFKITMGTALLPVIKTVADGLGSLVQWFMHLSPGTKQAIADFAAFSAAVMALVGGIAGLALAFGPLIGMFAEGGIFAAGGALAGVGATLAGLAGPIGIAIAAIGLLAAAWINDWGHIHEFTAEVWAGIKSGFASFGQELQPALKAVTGFFADAWQTIAGTARDVWTQIGPTVTGGMRMVWEGLKVAWVSISAWWGIQWEAFKDIVSVIWPMLKGVISIGLDLISGVIKTTMAVLTGDWGMAWHHLVDMLENVGRDLLHALSSALENLVSAAKLFGGKMQNAGASLWQSFSRGFLGAAEDQSNLLVSAQERAMNRATGRAMDAAKQGFSSASDWLSKIGVQGMAWVQKNVAPPAGGADQRFAGLHLKETGLSDVLDGLANGAKKAKHAHESEADAEDRKRAAVVRAAESLTGMAVTTNQCANTVRKVFGLAGVALGVAKTPGDYARTKGMAQGAGYANSLWGDDVGKFFREQSDARAGDLVLFQNTSKKYGAGIATHVAVITKVLKDGTIMIEHASSALGKVAEVSLQGNFRPDQILGYMQPKALGGSGGGELDAYRQKIERLMSEVLPDVGVFAGKRRDAEQWKRDMESDARDVGAGSDVFARILEKYREKLDAITEDEATAREDALAKLGALADKTEKYVFQQRIQAVMKGAADLEKAAQKAFDLGAITEGKFMRYQGEAALMRRNAPESAAADIAKDATAALTKNESAALREKDAALQTHLTRLQEERELNHVTASEYVQQMAQMLDAFTGSDRARQQLILKYSQAFASELKIQDGEDAASHQQRLAALQQGLSQATTLTTSQVLQQEALRAQALAKHRADLQKTQLAWQQFAQQVGSHFQNFLTGILNGHAKFKDAFTALWKGIADTIIGEISRIIAKLIEVEVVEKALGWLGSIFTGGIGGIMSGLGGAAPITSDLINLGGGAGGGAMNFLPGLHTGGFVVPGGVRPFHAGGLVTLKPNEVFAKLLVGETVRTESQEASLQRRLMGGRGEQPIATPQVTVIIERAEIHHTDDVRGLADQLGRRIGWHVQSAAAYSS